MALHGHDGERFYNGVARRGITRFPPTLLGVQFMTDAEFVARFGPEPGLAPDKLLCVVEVHGRFRPPGCPPGSTPRVYDVVYVVFNARTGNHLMLHM
jgi:hypothetical protein